MRQLSKIALRLLSIYVVLIALNYFNSYLLSFITLSFNGEFRWWEAILFGPLPTLLYLAAAAILWFGSEKLAGLICGQSNGESMEVMGFSDLGRIIYPIAGTLLVATAIPGIVNSIYVFSQQQTFSGVLNSVQIREVGDMLKGGIQIVIGLVLIFAGKPIAGLVKKAIADK